MISDPHPIIFFDGVCNLCNGWVQWVIRHDRNKIFLFSSLQSERGKAILNEIHKQYSQIPDSVILYYNGHYYTRSGAVLKIAALLGGWLKIVPIGWLIPAFIRNGIYSWVARHRYKWFGKRGACMVPAPDVAERFV